MNYILFKSSLFLNLMGDDIKMEVEDNKTPLKKTYAVSFQTDIIHEDDINEISRNSRF